MQLVQEYVSRFLDWQLLTDDFESFVFKTLDKDYVEQESCTTYSSFPDICHTWTETIKTEATNTLSAFEVMNLFKIPLSCELTCDPEDKWDYLKLIVTTCSFTCDRILDHPALKIKSYSYGNNRRVQKMQEIKELARALNVRPSKNASVKNNWVDVVNKALLKYGASSNLLFANS